MQGKSLLDRGANAGHATPKNMTLVAESATQRVDVVGMENHTCTDLPVTTAAAVVTRLGKAPFIGLFNQCAWNAADEGESIHSAIQLEAHGHHVNDKATAFGGKRMITTLEGDQIPLSIKDGLPHMDMRKPTDEDWVTLKKMHMTSDVPWDPTTHDEEMDICEFFDGIESVTTASVASDDSSYFDPIADDDYGEVFDQHELNLHRCARLATKKVHFELEDPDADDMPDLIPRTSNSKIKFVDELDKDKRFFKLPAFYDDDGNEVKPRAKPKKKPPDPCMGGTVNPPKSIPPKKPDYEAL